MNRAIIEKVLLETALLIGLISALLYTAILYFSTEEIILAADYCGFAFLGLVIAWFALVFCPVRKKAHPEQCSGVDEKPTESTDNGVSLTDKTKPMRYSTRTGQAQYKPGPKPTEKPAEDSTPGPEITGDDVFTTEHGYRPAQYMLAYQTKIEKFIARKLVALDGVKPWTVAPPFASLNSITIDINPADKSSLLYSTDFQNELLTRLPDGAELRRAGNGRKYPSIVIPRRTREFISTGEALAAFKPTGTRFVIGYDDDMQLITADLAEIRHLLILGTTGSGKGIATHNALISLLRANSPAQLQFIIIDPKQGEFANYDTVPHLLGERATDWSTGLDYLTWLVDESVRRQKLFAEHGCNNFDDFNALHRAQALPRLVLVFDELTRFYEMINDECGKPRNEIKTLNSKLCSLATSARSAGISMMLVTQNSKDTIPAKLLSELPGRLCFKMKKHALQASETDQGELDRIEQLQNKGDGLWFFETNIKRIQAPSIFSPAKELPALIAPMVEQYRDYPKSEINIQNAQTETDNTPASDDTRYADIVQFIIKSGEFKRKAIMERFHIGAPKLAKLVKTLEADKVIGPSKGRGPKATRDVMMTPVQYRKKFGTHRSSLPENVVLLNRS